MLSRMLVLSTFNSMPQDISVLAEDLMVSLILLPFHKRLKADGTLDEGHPVIFRITIFFGCLTAA